MALCLSVCLSQHYIGREDDVGVSVAASNGQTSNGRWRLSSSIVLVCRLSASVTLHGAT